MSISANYPTVAPSLNLDFANTKALDPRITFSRPTTASYYDANTTALAEQNLLTYSQDFTNGVWIKQGSTATISGSVTDPASGTNGNTITESVTTNYHQIYSYGVPCISGSVWTGSIYVKANTRTYCFVGLSFGSTSYGAIINLSTGAIGNQFNSLLNVTSTNVGSGWYRVSVTTTVTSTSVVFQTLLATADSPVFANLNYAGDGTSSIYAWGAQLEQRSSVTAYTPTTTTAITNYIPVLLTAPTNQARFDHDPVARTSLGLLIEQQSTNLLTYSSDFSNAVWTKANSTITTAADVSPDGTQNAQMVVENTATGGHQIYQAYTMSAGASATFSLYVKSAQRTRMTISFDSIVFTYNLSTLAVTGNATLIAVGNGWYRLTATRASLTSASGFVFIQLNDASGSSNYTGDGYSGMFWWGAQLEALAFPTSYIPTVASQVTRSADSASMTGANFSSWYQQGQGTLYTGFLTNNPYGANANYIACISDGTIANMINMANYVGLNGSVRINSTNIYSQTLGTSVVGIPSKSSISFTNTAATLAWNGAFTSGTYSGTANMTVLNIGTRADSNSITFLNGYIKKLAYYPVALSATQLQALTGS